MTAQILVCSGCCCGRIEKGNHEVPVNELKDAWKRHNITDEVELKITTCLGPCSMNNVSLLKIGKERIWLGKLNTMEHYNTLIDWANNVSNQDNEIQLPELLEAHRFTPQKL